MRGSCLCVTKTLQLSIGPERPGVRPSFARLVAADGILTSRVCCRHHRKRSGKTPEKTAMLASPAKIPRNPIILMF